MTVLVVGLNLGVPNSWPIVDFQTFPFQPHANKSVRGVPSSPVETIVPNRLHHHTLEYPSLWGVSPQLERKWTETIITSRFSCKYSSEQLLKGHVWYAFVSYFMHHILVLFIFWGVYSGTSYPSLLIVRNTSCCVRMGWNAWVKRQMRETWELWCCTMYIYRFYRVCACRFKMCLHIPMSSKLWNPKTSHLVFCSHWVSRWWSVDDPIQICTVSNFLFVDEYNLVRYVGSVFKTVIFNFLKTLFPCTRLVDLEFCLL